MYSSKYRIVCTRNLQITCLLRDTRGICQALMLHFPNKCFIDSILRMWKEKNILLIICLKYLLHPLKMNVTQHAVTSEKIKLDKLKYRFNYILWSFKRCKPRVSLFACIHLTSILPGLRMKSCWRCCPNIPFKVRVDARASTDTAPALRSRADMEILTVWLNDFKGVFQPIWFYGSVPCLHLYTSNILPANIALSSALPVPNSEARSFVIDPEELFLIKLNSQGTVYLLI